MKENCLDIGIIQAFLDGELSHNESARVSSHIAGCDGCAVMLADAENESAIVFPVLEREFNSLVPTQRLWNKINDSITVEREGRPFWHKAWSFLSVALVNPALASAASVLIAVGIFALVWTNRAPAVDEFVLSDLPAAQVAVQQASSIRPLDRPAVAQPPDRTTETRSRPALNYQQTSFRTTRARPDIKPLSSDTSGSSAADSNGFMPGEESYVKTIASLSRTIEDTKDGVMRPGQRIAYERDMAVVNDAITKMRQEVKRNPKNESAKQVLYSSYQNKIDLLSSVSQKEELMASIR